MESFLHFQSSAGSRLVRVSQVVEVIPMVALQHEQTDSNQFCGLLNYRGKIIPVFDLLRADENALLDMKAFLIVTQCYGSDVALIACEVKLIFELMVEAVQIIAPANLAHFEVAKVEGEMVRVVNLQEFVA